MVSGVQGVFKLIKKENFNMNPLCWKDEGHISQTTGPNMTFHHYAKMINTKEHVCTILCIF